MINKGPIEDYYIDKGRHIRKYKKKKQKVLKKVYLNKIIDLK